MARYLRPTIVRKSWVAFLPPLFSIFIGVLLLVWLTAEFDAWQAFCATTFGTRGIEALVPVTPFFLLLLWLMNSLWRFALLRSAVLTIDPDQVRYDYGILPWSKYGRVWQAYQIFDCHFHRGFFGWLFRFGSVTILDRAGTTQGFVITTLHNPAMAQMLVSSLAASYHSRQHAR